LSKPIVEIELAQHEVTILRVEIIRNW